MRPIKMLTVMVCFTFVMSSVSCFAAGMRSWNDVVESSDTVKIYVNNVVNKTDDKKVDADKITGIIKKVFADRISPKFEVVTSPDQADVIFNGKISDYVWSKEAPITNIYSPGALVLDEMTRGSKHWARLELDYKITGAKHNNLLLDYETQVTLKQPDVTEAKSYGMINDRLAKILSMDLFKRYKR